MTARPSAPVALTTEELIETLRDIITLLENNDSFGGFVEYDGLTSWPCPDCYDNLHQVVECTTCGGSRVVDDLPPGKDFMVRAGYRIGNSMGQGGMRFVCGED
jgi:hypothetical protein